MGIIRKQSLQSTIFIYAGFAIGALNVLVLFPNEKYFSLAEFGLTKVLVDVSLLIAMLCTLGAYPAVIKFYPFYNSYLPKKENDLPVWTFLTVLTGCLLFVFLMPFFKGIIIRKYGERSPLFVQYFNLIYPLTISMAFLYLFEAYAWIAKKTVLPAIARELIVRGLTTLLILMVMAGLLNFNQFINLYAFIYVAPVLFILYFLMKSGDLSFNFTLSSVTRRLRERIWIFSLFIFSGQVLNILAKTLDSIIISSQSPGGLQDTGIFTIATYFIALMEVPLRGMTGIAYSILSQAWKDKDLKKVFNVYRKTALNLLIAGLGIMGVLVLITPDVIAFLGPKYESMYYVVLLLGFSKLIDLGTGINSQLLMTSKHWRIEFFTNIFLVIMAGVFNYLLVRQNGILGSAWATLISFTLYNLIRFLLIWRLFKMQPFSMKNFYVLLIGLICFLTGWFMPFVLNIYVDAIVKAIFFSVLYGIFIIRFRISEDINDFFEISVGRMKRFFNIS
ncbi:MAG: polysaccharide biosynthesis C-terminal domain-containing protein [Bacteroidetes bacterium]|nr:polysaccharide biosynthesis C-terminal domain-containing protein [Bacteroidota bacterium]